MNYPAFEESNKLPNFFAQNYYLTDVGQIGQIKEVIHLDNGRFGAIETDQQGRKYGRFIDVDAYAVQLNWIWHPDKDYLQKLWLETEAAKFMDNK